MLMNELNSDEIKLIVEAIDTWVKELSAKKQILELISIPEIQSRLNDKQIRIFSEGKEILENRVISRERASVKLKAKLYDMLEKIEINDLLKR